MELHCIRHGETALNAAGVFSSWGDEGLTASQASALGPLHFDARPYDVVYCSPVMRCRETARYLGLSFYIAEPRIAERHFGVFDGLSVDEVRAAYPREFARFRELDADYVIPGGESRARHLARVEDWLDDLEAYERVLAITHGGTIDFLYRLGSNLDVHGGESVFAGPNAALSIFEITGRAVRVVQHGVPLAP